MIPGVVRLHVGEHVDERGTLYKPMSSSFAHIRECFYSWSKQHVLRGMHWQPYQSRIVVCISGHVVDVLLDMRKDSPTYGLHQAMDLHNAGAVYIPSGVAHGFYACESSLILYLSTAVYSPDEEKGIRWDSFGYDWPHAGLIISDRDRKLPCMPS